MEIFPVIDLSKLCGEERKATMEMIHDACENWGFFELVNHGIPLELMDTGETHEGALQEVYGEKIQGNDGKGLDTVQTEINDFDWNSSFLRHLPFTKVAEIPDLDEEYEW